MRDFFDLFDHRALSFFVRAAEKYRALAAFDRTGGTGGDAFGTALYSLIGLGQPSLRGRQAAPDQALAFYAGHYAHRPRTAEGLAQVLSDYFERPARITQFQGRWTRLPREEQTRLSATPPPGVFGALGASFSQLGVDAVCGSMVFDVQGSFRVGLGPLDYDQFASFLPDTPQMAALVAMARTYAGPAFSFDVQLTLKADAVPPLVLGDAATPPRLGWNTWLPTAWRLFDADEPVFEAEAA
jgi:type VI secretion system protein ImpH